jgi:hypothetical protein
MIKITKKINEDNNLRTDAVLTIYPGMGIGVTELTQCLLETSSHIYAVKYHYKLFVQWKCGTITSRRRMELPRMKELATPWRPRNAGLRLHLVQIIHESPLLIHVINEVHHSIDAFYFIYIR